MPAKRFIGSRSFVPFSSLPHLIEYQATRIPHALAILAPGRAPLTYRRMYQHIDEMRRTLRALGICRHDRIAVVLPNGPEMAVAFLAVSASAACAPFNPAYGTEELNRYFAALRPRAVIVQAGIDSPVRRVALSRGINVIDLLTISKAEAGLFTFAGTPGCASPGETPSPGDTALMLFTSGTTSRSKLVPLSHANLCASACSSVAAMALKEADRCINMVPLFHGHGLNNILLASFAAGASVVCAPGCDVNRFFRWLDEFRPTWYSAVPTMHQAILSHARRNHERAADHRLRFIRSSSAPLRPSVFADLERTFDAPVIDAYGMTESASSPIACSPLPPGRRKLGSVGVPVDLDVAIMDEGGALLRKGETGEIVIRGASVMAGYAGDELATAAAFAGEWFRTGDLGFFDDDGYLFLTGRIREIINRGGEKVAPQEVDEVLLKHPAVVEAVTFAVPHATLGEDVAAAVVLGPRRSATPKDIRQFALGHIAGFKVPRQIYVVREIPKGPTGKVQRIGLAAKLGLAVEARPSPDFVAPRIPLEAMLAKKWAELLQVEKVGVDDNFFALGGDSLLATQALVHIYEMTQVELGVSRFFEAPTVAEVTRCLERLMEGNQVPRPAAAIVRVPRENGLMPTSVTQERLWKLLDALPDIPVFNVVYALRLKSPCDAAVLERSINEIIRRHETLRTTFAVVDGRRMQVIAPELTLRLKSDDLRKLRRGRKDSAARRLFRQELLDSFDLASGPLVRARLACLTERESLLLFTMPEMIQDGWSLGVLMGELTTLYDAFAAGVTSPLPPLSVQFADFAYWQRRWRSYPDIVAQLDYWRGQLHDPLPVMELAKDSPRREPHDLATERRQISLPSKTLDAAKRFSQREGVTLFMTLLAAFKTLLHRYTGANDLRVATHVANRHRPGTSGLIGPLVNTVILRTNLDGSLSSRKVIERVRATTLSAFANQDIPLEEVVETLERERGTEPESLAQVMMWLQNGAMRPIASCGPGFAYEEADPGMLLPLATITSFDIMLMLRESDKGLVGTCVYKPQLFGARNVDRLLQDFRQVIEFMVANPEHLISAIPAFRRH